MKVLINYGADVTAITDDGKTALNLAEERKHPEVAAYLRQF
jgi:hypothetical protein